MFFTEIRTKDDKRGAIVMDEDVDNIIADCVRWFFDNKLKPTDMKKSLLVHWETQQSIGVVEFESDTQISFTPYKKPKPYKPQASLN